MVETKRGAVGFAGSDGEVSACNIQGSLSEDAEAEEAHVQEVDSKQEQTRELLFIHL